MVEAFLIGLIGSLHCLGMCGPIALTIPFSKNLLTRFIGVLIYNLGRVVTYGIIGALFGLFGLGLAMAGVQQAVSIILGTLMILTVLFPLLFKRIKPLERMFSPISNFVKNKLSGYLNKRSLLTLLPTGIINGLLPCGLVYAAVAKSLASGSIATGSIYMVLFGLGTIPLMVALPMLGSLGGFKFRLYYRKALPVFVITLGLLFILRGMNLGIKYISPKLGPGNKMEHCTCH